MRRQIISLKGLAAVAKKGSLLSLGRCTLPTKMSFQRSYTLIFFVRQYKKTELLLFLKEWLLTAKNQVDSFHVSSLVRVENTYRCRAEGGNSFLQETL